MSLFKKIRDSKVGRWGGVALLALTMFALGVWATSKPEETSTASSPNGEAGEQIWTCSMHPQVRQPGPGKCPICGMDLIPVQGAETGGMPAQVELSERAKIMAQIRTEPVRRLGGDGAKRRLLGRVTVDESTLRTVTAWIGGRIERLHVRTTGETVRRGQVIATLYSPEVYSAHQDLIAASRQLSRLGGTASPGGLAAAEAALEASRQRLRLMGVPESEVSTLQKASKPSDRIQIRSPYAGTVIERMATEGSYVSTGAGLYRLANLKELWVQLDAYESDLSTLSVGQAVRVQVDALPGEDFDGTVTFIDPTLDPMRRTAQVRVEVDNREGRLRPGMFAEATVATRDSAEEQSPLVVPSTAPLFTGRRSIVYVEVQAGDRTAYEARTVRLGPRTGEFYPVVAGLSEGERVVMRGAFALDADLQIRGGASMMASVDDREEGAWDKVIRLPPADRQALVPVVSSYLDMQTALADDDLPQTKDAAGKLAAAVQRIKLTRPREAKVAWSEISGELRDHAQHVAMASDLEGAREGFEPLSGALIKTLTRFGNPLDHPVRLAFCPMASGSEGARWVQKGTEVKNPYFGASMLDCGEVREELAPTGYLATPAKSPAAERSAAAPAGGHQH